MNPFNYYNPTQLIFGVGKITLLGKTCESLGQTVLLVYGGGSILKSGLYEKVIAQLEKVGKTIVELGGVEPNPRVSTVQKGIELCRSNEVDWVLAVGGGSVIDCAKAIAAGVYIDGDVWEMVRGKISPQRALPLGVVLTLAATGSEMNSFSVITNWETNEKIGWGSPHVTPRFSILDPELTTTVPREHTVNGIVDIMSHVLEQYFHHQDDTPITDGFCETILRAMIQTAPKVIEQPDHLEARSIIMHGGTMALNGTLSMGAIGDWATHNLEHAVSAIYDIPHGGGLAILFPVWMRYALSRGTDPKKFISLGEHVFGLSRTDFADDQAFAFAAIEALEAFWRSIGAPSRLADYHIQLTEETIEKLADRTMLRGPFGRYQKLQRADVIEIYRLS